MIHLPFFHKQPKYLQFSGNLLWSGLFCIIVGLAIVAAPELLAYIVAVFFLVIGISLLTAWWKMRNMGKHWSRDI